MKPQQRNRLRAILTEQQRRQAAVPEKWGLVDDEGYPIDYAGNRTGEPQGNGPRYTLDIAAMCGDNGEE